MGSALRHGEIVESRTHSQLLELNGFYEEYRHSQSETTERDVNNATKELIEVVR